MSRRIGRAPGRCKGTEVTTGYLKKNPRHEKEESHPNNLFLVDGEVLQTGKQTGKCKVSGNLDEDEMRGSDCVGMPQSTLCGLEWGCFDMLMGAWMGRWARIKGMQDPRGTGRRMLVRSQTGDKALGRRMDP